MLTHAEPPQRAESSSECWETGKTGGGEGWWFKNEAILMSCMAETMINDHTALKGKDSERKHQLRVCF